MPKKPIKILVVGIGTMGLSHAKAYHRLDEFEVVGLMSRSIKSRKDLPEEFGAYPRFEDFDEAMAATKPDAVSINTYPDTHARYALKSLGAHCHVFMEKPIATNMKDAEKIVRRAHENKRKLMLGYILRVHPSWMKFIEVGKTLGKPLVMRMNLNQQSSGPAWLWHRALLDSLTPIVDCGVHYVDVMCQVTGAKPVRVHGIGAKLWKGAPRENYGHLHVTFDDGSVGWYEAGWGPMMSEVAYFVKDMIGPKGSVSIVVAQDGRNEASSDKVSASADIDQHTKTNAIRLHHAAVDPATKAFVKKDELFRMDDEPDHQALCDREATAFAEAIFKNQNLDQSMEAAVNSLRIVLAADESVRKEKAIKLKA